MRMLRRLPVALACTAAMVGVLAGAPTAFADTSAHTAGQWSTSRTFVMSKDANTATLSLDGAMVQVVKPQITISCILTLWNPGVPTRRLVVAKATVSCSAPVTQISLSVYLYQDGAEAAFKNQATLGSTFLEVQATAVCQVGPQFSDSALGVVTFTPGSSQTQTRQSPTVRFTTCVN